MPQPTSTQVHVNKPLTNISIAYIQNAAHFVADKVFPVVPVDKQTDIYTVYTKNDWFRDEAQPRAPGTESAGSGYNIDNTNTYHCGVHAIHRDIDDFTAMNADAHINLDREAAIWATQRLLVRRERLWVTGFFATSIWGTDVLGVTDFTQWDNYSGSTPITDVETGKETVLQNTGFLPNTLVLGYQVFKALKNHPTIVDRLKYTSPDSITAEMLANVLDVERIVVAKSVYATNVEGETGAYSFAHGKNALLCYVNAVPSLYQPSAGYIMAWRGISGGIGTTFVTNRFRLEKNRSWRIESEFALDMKVVGSDLGYFFSAAVS